MELFFRPKCADNLQAAVQVMLAVYECWKDSGLVFFPADNKSARSMLTGRAKLQYKVIAASWNEAMQKHYTQQGWGKYKPMRTS